MPRDRACRPCGAGRFAGIRFSAECLWPLAQAKAIEQIPLEGSSSIESVGAVGPAAVRSTTVRLSRGWEFERLFKCLQLRPCVDAQRRLKYSRNFGAVSAKTLQ